jgi:hypothetical protein
MQVVILGIGRERALAHVAGTEDYRCGAQQTTEIHS